MTTLFSAGDRAAGVTSHRPSQQVPANVALKWINHIVVKQAARSYLHNQQSKQTALYGWAALPTSANKQRLVNSRLLLAGAHYRFNDT